MNRSLSRIIGWAALNPGYVKDYCEYWFEHVQVGYVPSLDKIQIACFDGDGACRLCIRYQWSRSGVWYYEIVPGRMYREPEESE